MNVLLTQTLLHMTALHSYFWCFALTRLEITLVSWQKVSMSRWPDSPGHWYFHYSRCSCHFILSHVYSNVYPISDRLNTPLSLPTRAWEASDVHVYSCHSHVLEYTQLFWLIGGKAHPIVCKHNPRAVTFNSTLTLISKTMYFYRDHFGKSSVLVKETVHLEMNHLHVIPNQWEKKIF